MSDTMNEVNGKPEQYKKLFIGGLKPETDENSLKDFYSKWGEIVDVVVIKDPKTTKSRGFGFVTFATGEGIDAAQLNRPHEIDGKVVDSKRAMPKNSTSPNIHANVNKIFVGGLKKEINEEHMREYFEKFGTVTEVSLVRNKQTNESKKFGFVTFDDNDTVDKIILSCPHKINDSKADVIKAVSKEEMRRNRYDQHGNGYSYGNNFNQNMSGGQGYEAYGQSYGNYGYQGKLIYCNYFQGYDSQNYDWNYGASGDFGSYNQGYVGGPMRGPGNQMQAPRPGPYQNNFQMR